MLASQEQLVQQLQAAAGQTARFQRFRRNPAGVAQLKLALSLGVVREVTLHTFAGQTLRGVLPEIVSTTICRFGYFEPDLTRALICLLRPGGTFLDVGAHIGYFSVLASRLVGPQGRVVAFEPTPRTAALTRRNLAPYPQARVVGMAAWNRRETLTFNDFGWAHSAYNSFTAPRLSGQAVTATPLTVPATDLDSYIEENGLIPSLIKIDAESAEMQVLQGLERTMARHGPILSIEVGDKDIAGVPSSAAILGHALARGYAAFDVTAGGLHPHVPRQQYRTGNILLAKTDLSAVRLAPLAVSGRQAGTGMDPDTDQQGGRA